MVECPTCNGSGTGSTYNGFCPHCGGGGEVTAEKAERLQRCECEGDIIPGVHHPAAANGVIASVERCDTCERYPGDLDAALALAAVVGGEVWFQLQLTDELVEDDEDLPDGAVNTMYTGQEFVGYIASGTAPWIILTPVTPEVMADKRQRLLAIAADLAP